MTATLVFMVAIAGGALGSYRFGGTGAWAAWMLGVMVGAGFTILASEMGRRA